QLYDHAMTLSRANVRDRHRLARRELLGHDPDDVRGASDRLPVDCDDHVSAADELLTQQLAAIASRPEACGRAGCARVYMRNHGTVGDRIAELLCNRRDQVLGLYPDEGV